jgi:hypothetical protein
MKTRVLTMPEIFLLVGTRVALGIGIGLLVGRRLSDNARRGAGWALAAIGAVTTVPLALSVMRRDSHGSPVQA